MFDEPLILALYLHRQRKMKGVREREQFENSKIPIAALERTAVFLLY